MAKNRGNGYDGKFYIVCILLQLKKFLIVQFSNMKYINAVQPSPPSISRNLHLIKLKLSSLYTNALPPSPENHHSFYMSLQI